MLNLTPTQLDIVWAIRDHNAATGHCPGVTRIASRICRGAPVVSLEVKAMSETGIVSHRKYERQVELSPGVETNLDGPRCPHCNQLLPKPKD